VLYTVRKFSDTDGPVALGSLADGLKEVLANTVKRVQAFKQTLSNDRLNVALQPIVGLGDRRVHHFEALARPTDGQSPATMVGFAEEIGMTQDFDLLVCQKAIDILTEARGRGTDASVAINLSAVSLDSQVFVKTFRALVAQSDWAVGRLLIEVTESMRIKDLEATNTVLQVLRADGHKICLDDFGAGAASFPYIQALDVDYVKIDGAYVKRMETHPRDRAILKAMVGLCRDLGIGTVAEMVETEGQAKALVDLGVDYAQGYLFGRPSLEFNFPPAAAAIPFPSDTPARAPLRRRGSVETWGR
jgi:EAL domain-containing protein (putative c-di-GMP-specific phosphodiesterase class I)